MLDGIAFLQKTFREGKLLKEIAIDDFPLDSIPAHLKRYLLERDEASRKKIKPITLIHHYRFEFYVYDHLGKQLSANKIHSNDSTQYKSFSDDIQLKKTAKEKKKLLHSIDASRLDQTAEALLDELEAELEPLIVTVNNRIESEKIRQSK